MTVDYDATLGFGLTLAFTPDDGAPVEVPIEAVYELSPPVQQASVAKYTPLDGDRAGQEQVVAGKDEAVQSTIKVPHTSERYEALAALYKLPGTYTLTLNDGGVLEATGFLSKIGVEQLSDSALQAISLTFELAGGWTPTAP